MGKSRLSDQQVEIVLDWINERDDAFTIHDVEVHFGCHYQTAWAWVTQLESAGLVDRLVMRRGGKTQFVKGTGEAISTEQAVLRSLKVQRGNKTLDLAEWAATHLQDSSIVYCAAGVIYLFVRSYYADAPDHQHLRGVISSVDVRGFIANMLKELKKDIEVIEQILSYRVPFSEGGDLAQRFGTPPVGFDMNAAMEVARNFSMFLRPPQQEVDQQVVSQSPPMPPAEPERASIVDVINETGLHVVPNDGVEQS